MIQAVEETSSTTDHSLTREEARQRLLAVGKLSLVPVAPPEASALSEAERERLAALFGGGTVTTLDIINQERGLK